MNNNEKQSKGNQTAIKKADKSRQMQSKSITSNQTHSKKNQTQSTLIKGNERKQ